MSSVAAVLSGAGLALVVAVLVVAAVADVRVLRWALLALVVCSGLALWSLLADRRR